MQAKRTSRTYRTSWARRSKTKERRKKLSPKLPGGGRSRCINENLQGTHGAPTHGVRCTPCHETYKETCR